MAEKTESFHRFFFILLFLGGSYLSLKYYVYTRVLKQKIKYEQFEIGIFPLAILIDDLKEFSIKNKNIISVQKVSAELPFFSLFSKIKEINFKIYQPRIILDESLLKKNKNSVESDFFKNFKIGKIDIIDGELIFNSPGFSGNLVKFNLKSFQLDQVNFYRFKSSFFRVGVSLGKEMVSVGGELVAEVKEELNYWKINRFYWDTPYLKLNINGKVTRDSRFDLNAYIQGSLQQFLDPLLGKLSVRENMHLSARIKKDKEGLIAANGNIDFTMFTFGGERFDELKGTVEWDNVNKRIQLDLGFHDEKYPTKVQLQIANKIIRLEGEKVSAEKITRIVAIDDIVPVGGSIEKFRLKIHGKEFTGRALLGFNPHSIEKTKFNVAGELEFFYHSGDKLVRFTSPSLKSEFGQIFNLKGVSDPTKEPRLTLRLNATIEDAAYLDKYTTFFIDFPLNTWALSRGAGILDLDLKRIEKNFQVQCDFNIRDMYSGVEKIQSLAGHIESKSKLTTGTLSIDDPNLTCKMVLSLDKRIKKDYHIYFNNVRGESSKIMNILGYDLSLYGPVKGDFVFSNVEGMPHMEVDGAFQSPGLNLYDFIFEDISGTLKYSSSISLKNLSYKYLTGTGSGNVFIDFKEKQFNIDTRIKDIDLNRLNSQFKGVSDLTLKGKGTFMIDPVKVTYSTGDIHFYRDRSFKVKGDGNIFTNFSDFQFETKGSLINKNSLSPYSIKLNKEEKKFSGNFNVHFSELDLLIPWENNKGEIDLSAEIMGQRGGGVNAQGHATFKGKELSIPSFPHSIKDFSGDVIFKNLDFNLRSFKGMIGGGPVEGNGYLFVKDNHLDGFRLNLSGKAMTLYPMDRTSFYGNAEMAISYVKERDKILMSGTLDLLSGLWEREIDESMTFNTNASLSASGTTIMDMLEYDLKLVTKGFLHFNNSFGEGDASFNLRLSGPKDFPVLTGLIESKKGKVNFSGKKFDLIKARLLFNNKFGNTPVINVESEAFIKNYRIRFTITGAKTVKPELQSSPPLPPRDILSLIAVGELFRRPTSAELSTQIGTGTTNLIASQITQELANRTKKIFGNYMLRLEPNLSNVTGSSVDTSRLIVGKEISKDFLIVYSTDFSTKRQQVVYLQYQISPSLSLIGMRNEDGRISLDLRYRKRK